MQYVCLSQASFRHAQSLHVPASLASVDTLPELPAFLGPRGDKQAVVVADVSQIDNRMVDVVHDLTRTSEWEIGIVPFDSERLENFSNLLMPSEGVSLEEAVLGLYSKRGLKVDLSAAVQDELELARAFLQLSFDSGDVQSDISQVVTRHDFDCLGLITEGRQTYCLLGQGCLHPSRSDQELGRISPRNVRASHWLLQSCHSPFAWRDLGAYLSIPLAIALTTRAKTVIASTHVQTYIPGLFDVFASDVMNGSTAGQAVNALNRHAEHLAVDCSPFVLLGNPNSRIVRASRREQASGNPAGQFGDIETRVTTLALLRRLIGNIEFLREQSHFGFEPRQQQDHDMARFFRQTESLLPAFRGRLRRPTRGGQSDPRDLNRFVSQELAGNDSFRLEALTPAIRKMWRRSGGFYALGEQLDESYLPIRAAVGDQRCRICDEPRIERRMHYFGLSSSRDYAERVQRVCPKCLVTEHINPTFGEATAISVKHGSGFLSITLQYTNRTDSPQWVFAFAFPSDPNNVSRNTSPRVYQQLLALTRTSSSSNNGRTLNPGESFFFEAAVAFPSAEFFYLLFEINLFVDFCWNWFSFTSRTRNIEKWLTSEEYGASLPRAKA